MSIELPCKAAALNASTFSALPRAKNIFLIVTGICFITTANPTQIPNDTHEKVES